MEPLHRRSFLGVVIAAAASAHVVSDSLSASAEVAPVQAAPIPRPVAMTAAPVAAPAIVQPVPPVIVQAPPPVLVQPTVPAVVAAPRWQRYAAAGPSNADRPAITIVIDDLGVVHPATERVIAMPGPLTLSWFPFAKNLPAQVAAGAARGHEATLHMPMQSFGNTTAWTGPDPLRVDLAPAVNLARLRAAIEAVPNTVGLNNHMGSVATRDPALMALVAQECKDRSMLFLDSVVIAHSYGYSAAHDAGVPAAARDIFIDHSPKPQDIREQLAQIEAQARRHGHVIAIGHPWPHTVAALEEWLPTLQAKGFSLWPLSAMVARRNELKMPAVVPA